MILDKFLLGMGQILVQGGKLEENLSKAETTIYQTA